MKDSFLALDPAERAEALAVAADRSGRPADILEKDVWVVWTLGALFGSAFANHLCFKGGTSLSKAYKVIARFSEDVDVTYDVRALLPDLVGNAAADPLPPSRSRERKWSKLVRERLPEWVEETALPAVRARLEAERAPAVLYADGYRLHVRYDAVSVAATDYVLPAILLEFGARSTGEPVQTIPVGCDAAEHLPSLSFPNANPRVMAAERTFWEKATAAHAFCLEGRLRGERFARHWYDLARLDEAGLADRALANSDLGRAVAHNKNWFFPAKAASGVPIEYRQAVDGGLRLVPERAALVALADDYGRMVSAGLLEVSAPSFDEVMRRCRALEDRANHPPTHPRPSSPVTR
jgi:Nucleotidyl transferase AbiEii toxin, Type IV TA system